MKKKKGLTLIELLAVIAIIAILFTLLIPQVNNAIDKARISGVQADLRSYQIAGQSYFTENNGEVKTTNGFNQYLDKNLQFEDSKSKELNPWGYPYEIIETSDGLEIVVKTNKEKDDQVVQYELGMKEENGEFETKVNGFEEIIVGSKPTMNENNQTQGGNNESTENGEPEQNTNDLDNDGWDDSTNLPIGEVSNVDDSVFTTQDLGNGKIAITGYSGQVTDLIIPSVIRGGEVVKIEQNAFFPSMNGGKNTGMRLTSVIIPKGVTSIGVSAFQYNQIVSAIIPNTVTSIENSAFRENQIKAITIPNSVNFIGDSAFVSNQIETVTIPNSLITVGVTIFYNNQNLKTVTNCSSLIKPANYNSYFNSSPTFNTNGC